MKKKYFCVTAFLLALCLCFASLPGLAVKADSRTEDLKDKAEKKEEENKELEKKVSGMEKEIEAMDQKIEKASNKADKLEKKLNDTKKQVSDTKEKLSEAKASKEKQYKIMSKRIKYLYENGNTGYIDVIVQAKSFNEFLTRLDYVSKISNYDNNMFRKLRKTQDRIALASKKLEESYKEIKAVTKEAKAEEAKIVSLADSKKSKLIQFQQKIASNKDLMQKYQDRIDYYDTAANKPSGGNTGNSPSSGSSRPGGSSSGSSGGSSSGNHSSGGGSSSLTWPVPSCHTITSPYGNRTHPVQGGTKFHEGIDIGAPKGSAVVAAGSGTVEVAGYSPYNGNWVKIDHGNGLETLYLHNSSLNVSAGQRVSRGQKIASSGSTGMSTGPHVHFAVKKNGSYVNPMNYM